MKSKLTQFSVLLTIASIAFPVGAKTFEKRVVTSKEVDKEIMRKAPRAEKKLTVELPMTRKEAAKSSKFATPKSTFKYSRKNAARYDQLKVNSNITVWGNVIYSDDDPVTEEAGNADGYYEIAGNGSFTLLGGTKTSSSYAMSANAGVFVKDDTFWTVDCTSFWGFIWVDVTPWSMDTWTQTDEETTLDEEFYCTSFAYEESTGLAYGCFLGYDDDDNQYYAFAKVDFFKETKTEIAQITGETWNGAFFDGNGQLYCIDFAGDLYKVDKETGAQTKVGATGYVSQYKTGAAYDKKGGKAYWTVSPADETGFLTEVDLTTGKATKVCDFTYNDEVVGLYIPAAKADDKAPDYVSDMTLAFSGNDLSGNVNFTMPTKLFGGDDASGEMTYNVYVDDALKASGKSNAGAAVSVPMTLTESAKYKFQVSASNSDGEGPKTKITQFVGVDVPSMPLNVKSSYADGNFTVTWDAVTAGANGGYIDPEQLTYTVTRQPDNVVVAQNITATSVTDPVSTPDNLTAYIYSVVANYKGGSSNAGTSNTIALGSIVPPYTQDFDSDDALTGYTIIDANEDSATWKLDTNKGKAYCRYSSSNDMNDWLITPAIKFEGGKIYNFQVDLSSYSTSWPERAEIFLGTSPSAEGMTTVILPSTEVAGEVAVNEYVTIPAAGTYYIGIHGISDADQFYLYVDNLSIGAAMSALAPSCVTDIVATPDYNGATKADFSFKAPTKVLSETADLSNIEKIEVYRGETLVKTFDNPTPGATLTFTDTAETSGRYTYTFVPYNTEGAGKTASASVFLGINTPGAPTNVSMVETANIGEVTMTWDAPAVDVDGNAFNPALCTYQVTDYYGEVYADNLTATTCTFRAVAADADQEFAQFYVFAVSTNGSSDGQGSNLVAVGKPYTLPFNESFDEADLTYNFATYKVSGSSSWGLYDDSTLGIADADGTNGFAACKGSAIGDDAVLYTGKIDLAGATKPVVTFYTYNISGDGSDTNNLNVIISTDGQTFSTLKTVVVGELPAAGWNKVKADLSAYAGKVVYIGFDAIINAYAYTMLDAIKVAEAIDNNLSASAFTVPTNVYPDKEYQVSLIVANEGAKAASAFSVDLYRNGSKIATKNFYSLEADASTTVRFNETLNVASDETNEYFAIVAYEADQDLNDNETESASAKLVIPNYPTVSNLVGKVDGSKVALSWTAPDLSAVLANDTDDFESYESWATSGVGDWTFYDQDGGLIGGIQSLEIPNIDAGTKQSFWVMDSSLGASFTAHSGTKYLCQMYVYSGSSAIACDDWAVSPLLTGNAQTISMYARSYSSSYPESFEVHYSTTDNAVSSFKKLASKSSISSEWTEYTFDLPEGTKYFAIRCISEDCFMFMVDDVTFAGAGAGGYELSGYNVYRDGIRLNEALVTTPAYDDNEPVADSHTYAVSAVYSQGESRAERATVDLAGVASITVGSASVGVNGHNIVVTAADTRTLVTVSAIDGKVLYSATGNATVPVTPGIYVVKAGKLVKKVIVK